VELILGDERLDLRQFKDLLALGQFNRAQRRSERLLTAGARGGVEWDHRVDLGFGKQVALLVMVTKLCTLGFGFPAPGLGRTRRCSGWGRRGGLR